MGVVGFVIAGSGLAIVLSLTSIFLTLSRINDNLEKIADSKEE